jgi:hypothetical protein
MKYISSLRVKEKVKMKRVGSECKAVVTDKRYDVLTGKGKWTSADLPQQWG